MAHHMLPMSYKPKKDAVFAGRCKQSIRLGRRFAVGDTLTIFEWQGKPRHSKWGRRIPATVTSVVDILLCRDQIMTERCSFPRLGSVLPWTDRDADQVAAADGIDPPTGPELKRVLESYHGPLTGQPAQILRW